MEISVSDANKLGVIEVPKFKIEIIDGIRTPKVEPIEDVTKFITDNVELLNELGIFLVHKCKNETVGFAANQLMVNGERLMFNFFMTKSIDPLRLCDLIINPVIHSKKGSKRIMYEGCLTWKNKFVEVERQPCINVSYVDFEGVKRENIEIVGFEAQVFQHEIDHLNGVEEKLVDHKIRHKYNINRNNKCQCGSEKKYKNCCWLYDQTLY